MEHSILSILDKCESTLLAKLWLFYRDYFYKDKSCLEFLQSVFVKEPNRDEAWKFSTEDKNDESVFIPRRMINSTMRLVSAARDMEQIRSGKDVFKIVYLVSCIESLQILCGNRNYEKWKMIQDFFVKYVSDSDKEKLLSCFKRSIGDYMYEYQECDENKLKLSSPDERITIEEFAAVINELRNCASHEGKYGDFSFCSSNDSDFCLQVFVVIDLKRFTSFKGEKTHMYETQLTYHDFESIFVRACIQLIIKYIHTH